MGVLSFPCFSFGFLAKTHFAFSRFPTLNKIYFQTMLWQQGGEDGTLLFQLDSEWRLSFLEQYGDQAEEFEHLDKNILTLSFCVLVVTTSFADWLNVLPFKYCSEN